MTTLATEVEVGRIPVVAAVTPGSLDSVTPMQDILGDPPASDPGYIKQAAALAATHPTSVVAWARLAQAEEARGNLSAARESAQRAVECAGASSEVAGTAAAAILARTVASIEPAFFDRFDSPVARIHGASAALEQSDYASAIARLEGIASPAASVLRGFAFLNTGDPARAVAEYRAARRSGRHSLDVLINEGVALSRLGSFVKAERITRQAIERAPTNTTASYNAARYRLQLGDRSGAAAVLDRLSAARPADMRASLYRAWMHADRDAGAALRILADAKTRHWGRADPITQCDVTSSIAYLRCDAGRLSKELAKATIWAALRGVSFRSPDSVRLLLKLLEHRRDAAQTDALLAEAGDALDRPNRGIVESTGHLLRGELDDALRTALEAHADDPGNEWGTAATAAFLLGEVRGRYAEAAELCAAVYDASADVALANNYAFSLGLSGQAKLGLQILGRFELDFLPFGGATVALCLLADGRVEEGRAAYRAAEERVHLRGDQDTAGYIAVRGGLAARQLGLDIPEASGAWIESHWPDDPGDPRWAVMSAVAERVGLAASSRPATSPDA